MATPSDATLDKQVQHYNNGKTLLLWLPRYSIIIVGNLATPVYATLATQVQHYNTVVGQPLPDLAFGNTPCWVGETTLARLRVW